MNETIRNMAYNAVFGGFRCEEFIMLTVPALITLIIGLILFFNSIKTGKRYYDFGDASTAIFGLGWTLFVVDILICYILDPQEDGILLNIFAFILLGFVIAISYLMITIIPFLILTILLFISHDIAIIGKAKAAERELDNLCWCTKEEKIEAAKEMIRLLKLQNSYYIRAFIEALINIVEWKKNNYKGISIYGIWIHNFFTEHGKLIIKAPFDDDMVNIVRENIHEFSPFSLTAREDCIGIYELEYSLYFGTDEEKKMALDDITTVAEMINIKEEINFPK